MRHQPKWPTGVCLSSLKGPTFVPLKDERPKRPREYWTEKNFKWPADKEPRPAWRYLPHPGYRLKDNLPYPCTATAIVAHCTTFLHLLRMVWTKDGWAEILVNLFVPKPTVPRS